MDDDGRRSGSGPWVTVTLAVILALATGLRAYGLASWPLEQDELYTLRDALDLGMSVRPVFYALEHVLVQFFAPTPFLLRFPAFVFGVLGVWVTWRVARRVFGAPAGLTAAGLVAISPWHLYQSQFARYYTLLYLLSALLFLALFHARETDRPGSYLVVLLLVFVGALTHPTFLFPLTGAALAAVLVSPDGDLGLRWPRGASLRYLWGPLMAIGAVAFAGLALTGNLDEYANRQGRSLAANLRLVPAIVQSASPVVAAAALLGGVYLLASGEGRDRFWGTVALGGMLGTVGILVVAAFQTNVYAAYATAMMPLAFVTIGGGIQRVSYGIGRPRAAVAWGLGLILAAGILPSTVSHLSNGTRFDYRPAYRYVQEHGPERLVVGWPGVLQRRYAPDLRFRGLTSDTAELSGMLERESGYWLIGSYRRYGMAKYGIDGWVRRHCREELVTHEPRFDYRLYRVELHWCGEPREGAGS